MNTLSCVFSDEEIKRILSEFDRLQGKCYADNVGSVLYPKSLITAVNEEWLSDVFVNPHTSKDTADIIDQIRYRVLKHFNADPLEYTVIFNSGTTSGLKTVAETFRFNHMSKEGMQYGSFVYVDNNHTSALGMREIAIDRNADVTCIPHDTFLEIVNATYPKRKRDDDLENHLFVFPAQSNFNGFKYDLQSVGRIQNGCLNPYMRKLHVKKYSRWHVCLDAASFASTSKLDLSVNGPEFLCLSFYKIFGFPTGLGALIVKNCSEDVLSEKLYFGGGTVDFVLGSDNFHIKRKNLSQRFEDGTINFLSILALKHCFNVLENLIPKKVNDDVMDTISRHTFNLARELYLRLKSLCHGNGSPVVVLYADSEYNNEQEQGGVVTFNLLNEDGSFVGYSMFQKMASLFNVIVRTGCFCNAGTCQRYLGFNNDDLVRIHKAGFVCGDENDLIDGKPTGCIRASFGYYNTSMDVDRIVALISRCFIKHDVSHAPKKIVGFTLNSNKKKLKSRKGYTIKKQRSRKECITNENESNMIGINRHDRNVKTEKYRHSLTVEGAKADDQNHTKLIESVQNTNRSYSGTKFVSDNSTEIPITQRDNQLVFSSKRISFDKSLIKFFKFPEKFGDVILKSIHYSQDNVNKDPENDELAKDTDHNDTAGEGSRNGKVLRNIEAFTKSKDLHNGDVPKKDETLMNSVILPHSENSKVLEASINSETDMNYNILENDIKFKDGRTGHLNEIAIFPIKSCGAFKIEKWSLCDTGFQYDRSWAIVKDNGVCLTQKQCKKMCLIKPVIDLEKRILTLTFPGKNPISIPLEVESNERDASLCQSKVCNDSVRGFDCGDDVSYWISEALEKSFLRLIKQRNTDERFQKALRKVAFMHKTSYKFASLTHGQENVVNNLKEAALNKENINDANRPIEQTSDKCEYTKKSVKKFISLSNQAQFLLINKASVAWLKTKIVEGFDGDLDNLTDRFRANLIIDMGEELVENNWDSVFIGTHQFKVEGPCSRCQMVCIDQSTGETTIEPLRTISEQFQSKLRFGIYLSYVGSTDESKVLTCGSKVMPLISANNGSQI